MRAIAWYTFHGRLKTRSPVTQELIFGGDGGAVDQELGTSCGRPLRHARPTRALQWRGQRKSVHCNCRTNEGRLTLQERKVSRI